MDQQKVDMFIMNNREKLPELQIPVLREKLLALDDSKWMVVSTIQFKEPMIALVISLFLGVYGIDRFYLGQAGLGIGKLLTCGGVGIWAIVDLFQIMGATKNINYEKLQNYLV